MPSLVRWVLDNIDYVLESIDDDEFRELVTVLALGEWIMAGRRLRVKLRNGVYSPDPRAILRGIVFDVVANLPSTAHEYMLIKHFVQREAYVRGVEPDLEWISRHVR